MTPTTLIRATVVVATLLGATLPAAAQRPMTGDVLYRMILLRAAPDQYPQLLAEIRRFSPAPAGTTTSAATQVLRLRHSQGDQWDFMLLWPVAAAAGAAAPSPFSQEFVAWEEDELVRGPAFDVAEGFMQASLYHLEMFDAMAGKVDAVVEQREMENAYGAALGRPPNLIFRREFGGAWDAFTIDAYRNWRHYAERDLTTPEQARAAAKAAGFESEEAVGPRLRSLIITHQDTFATAIR